MTIELKCVCGGTLIFNGVLDGHTHNICDKVLLGFLSTLDWLKIHDYDVHFGIKENRWLT